MKGRSTQHVAATLVTGVLLMSALGPARAVAQEDKSVRDAQAVRPPHGGGESGEPLAPGAFGPGAQITVVQGEQFAGKFSQGDPDLTYGGFYYFTSPGSVGPTRYFAPLLLPSGARITDITCFVRDDSVANDVVLALDNYYYDMSNEQHYASTVVSFRSSGSSGYQRIRAQGFGGYTVRYAAGTRYYTHELEAQIAGDTALRSCTIEWYRQVSPPQSEIAVFSDVPLGDWRRPYVEALAASGITLGCGGGNFCPDASLTRWQMAVFLSRALGLHWPY